MREFSEEANYTAEISVKNRLRNNIGNVSEIVSWPIDTQQLLSFPSLSFSLYSGGSINRLRAGVELAESGRECEKRRRRPSPDRYKGVVVYTNVLAIHMFYRISLSTHTSWSGRRLERPWTFLTGRGCVRCSRNLTSVLVGLRCDDLSWDFGRKRLHRQLPIATARPIRIEYSKSHLVNSGFLQSRRC